MEEVTKSLIIDKNKSIPVSNFADDPELLHWRWTGQELGVHVRPVPTHQRFDSHLQTARLLRLSVPLQPTCIEQQPRHRSRHISPQRIACTDHTSYTHSRIGSLQSRLLPLARQDNYELQLPIPRPISRRQNPHQQLDILLSPSPSFSPCLPSSPHSSSLTAMATPRTFARALTRLRPSSAQTTSSPYLRRFRSKSTGPATISRALATHSTPRAISRIIRPAPSVPVRSFSSTPSTRHGHVEPPKPGEELWVTFIDKDGQEHKVAVSKGDNLLDIAQAHDLEMEGTWPSPLPPSTSLAFS